MILELDQGVPRQRIARDLQCAPATVVAVAQRFLSLGDDGLLDQRAGDGELKANERFKAELRRVLLGVPTEYGWQRPTWTRELLCLEMERLGFPKITVCTMGVRSTTLERGWLCPSQRIARGIPSEESESSPG